MKNVLNSVTVKSYPVLHLIFNDGFSGDRDLSQTVAKGPLFDPLKDSDFFACVKLDKTGHSFGWRLDNMGNEIDFSVDGARIDLEAEIVRTQAVTYRLKIEAAE